MESCVNQEIPSELYEIICIDDGSSDGSSEILFDYENNNDNIIVVTQSNKGASSARNKGIEKAKGKYIWFIDSDDFIPNGILKELHENYCRSDYDMVLFGAYSFVDTLSEGENEQYKNGTLHSNQAIQSIYITRRLIKRDFLDMHCIRFNEKITYGEDSLFDYIIYANNPRVEIYVKLGYFYRIHAGSLMRNKSYESKIKFIDSHISAVEIVKSYYDKESKKRFRTIRFILNDVQVILDAIAGIPFEKAKEEIQKLQSLDILPFKKHEKFNKKDLLITLYTNIMCCIYSLLISISSNKFGFNILKCESKVMNGKRIKKLIKKIKEKFSHMSKD